MVEATQIGGFHPSYVQDLTLGGLIHLVEDVRKIDARRRHSDLAESTAAARGDDNDLRRAYGRLQAEAGLQQTRLAGNVNDLARVLAGG